MKTTEGYLDDYLDKYNELKKKNELWRLRVTPQKFLEEVEKIRVYSIEAKKNKSFNRYHIHKSETAAIEIMLMGAATHEEMKAQFERLDKAKKMEFAAEAPEIQQQVKTIITPLKLKDVINIYRWLFRNQITLEMLPNNVLEEFSKTRQYKTYLQKRGS